jgi:hypothetical protein
MKLPAALLLVASLAAAVPASADPGWRAPRARARARVALRARFDLNHDGRLDAAERTAMRAYIYARLLRRFDLNGDGRLGPDEVPPRIAMRLRRFDRNGDGWVDPAEIMVPPRRARQLPPDAPPPAPEE